MSYTPVFDNLGLIVFCCSAPPPLGQEHKLASSKPHALHMSIIKYALLIEQKPQQLLLIAHILKEVPVARWGTCKKCLVVCIDLRVPPSCRTEWNKLTCQTFTSFPRCCREHKQLREEDWSCRSVPYHWCTRSLDGPDISARRALQRSWQLWQIIKLIYFAATMVPSPGLIP